MENKKMTKMQKFEMLSKLDAVKSNPVLSEFVAHEMELLSKKNSAEKKPTAQQTANAGIQTAILEGLEVGEKYTITDIIKEIPECNDLSTPKVSSLVNSMPERVERIPDKRKTYFRVIVE